MNTLSYGLLSLLSLNPQSGYDLMHRIQPFWPAKHSQIYPLLSCLEKEGLVQFETVAQTDKPDKKVYSVTESGRDALRKWLSEPTDAPALRDALMLKIFCISLSNPDAARALIEERAGYYRCKLDIFKEKLETIREKASLEEEDAPVFGSPYFGSYVLVQRALSSSRSDLNWCEWVVSLLPPGKKPETEHL
ncbi:PadR family transcriptional regulator [Cohnella faecalis]|uniref:PadR family transcriptional regulator n=1 Tax=Cohnella faecalis TaxID=2315694 RepID=A0A398CIR6_9BACL|nr:PadR family transcriptional regulator [Cohnella faecalis]RIE02275.1 PadR family transcriptional regulator [Cohnella faecalis]